MVKVKNILSLILILLPPFLHLISTFLSDSSVAESLRVYSLLAIPIFGIGLLIFGIHNIREAIRDGNVLDKWICFIVILLSLFSIIIVLVFVARFGSGGM